MLLEKSLPSNRAFPKLADDEAETTLPAKLGLPWPIAGKLGPARKSDKHLLSPDHPLRRSLVLRDVESQCTVVSSLYSPLSD
jgi:hypothetical protein